jgi:vacuolar-type H+-ATPase subunit I/STV1
MNHFKILIFSVLITLINSALYASANSSHSFPVDDSINEKVKSYEWYLQRTQQMMERTRQSENRFNQINRERDWRGAQLMERIRLSENRFNQINREHDWNR